MDFSTGFSEEAETRFSNEDSAFKVFDNSKKLPNFNEEALQQSGIKLALASPDVGNPNF